MKGIQETVRNYPLRYKLRFLGLFPSCIALCFTFVHLAYQTKSQFREKIETELSSLTEIIAQASEAMVLFNDADSAQRLAEAFSVQTSILSVVIVGNEGNILASYYRGKSHQPNPREFSATPGMKCSRNDCLVTRRIGGDNGKAILYLKSDLAAIDKQLKDTSRVMGWSVLIAFLVALCIANSLQKIISEPLLELTRVVKVVSSEHNYSKRAPTLNYEENANEIAVLIYGVNHMLEEIQSRENELRRARDYAEQANKAKSDFVANTSHELRTPLANIIAITEVIVPSLGDNIEGRRVQLIKSSAEDLLEIIEDILNISKIEAGILEFYDEPTDLKVNIAETLLLYKLRAESKSVELGVSLDETLPRRVLVDPKRLAQVIKNLVGNAIKFTSSGGSVAVAVRNLEGTGSQATIRVIVSDTGIGIPKQAQKHIFDAFCQADSSTTRRFGGTGLGLAISSRIVQKMGGEISLESEEGKGSTFAFTITLPLVEEMESFVDEVQPSPISVLAEGVSYAKTLQKTEALLSPSAQPLDRREDLKVNVLLVDDNAISREMLALKLKKYNISLSVAKCGKEAIELSSKKEFRLILMDWQMPDLDGFQTTAQIREFEGQSPTSRRAYIVAFTANAMAGFREQCLKAGMDDYCTKPLKDEKINELLRKCSAMVEAPTNRVGCV